MTGDQSAEPDDTAAGEPRTGPDAEPQQAEGHNRGIQPDPDEDSGMTGAAKYSTGEEEVVNNEDRDPFDRDA